MGAAYNTPLDYNAEFTGGDVRFGVAYAAVYQRGQMVWDGDSQSQASGSFFKTEFGGQPVGGTWRGDVPWDVSWQHARTAFIVVPFTETGPCCARRQARSPHARLFACADRGVRGRLHRRLALLRPFRIQGPSSHGEAPVMHVATVNTRHAHSLPMHPPTCLLTQVLAFHTAYVDTHRGGGERVIDVHFSRRHGYLDFPELMGTRQPLILGFQVKDEAGLDQSLMHVFLAEPPLYQAAKVDLDRAVQGTTVSSGVGAGEAG